MILFDFLYVFFTDIDAYSNPESQIYYKKKNVFAKGAKQISELKNTGGKFKN
jgi:hypothetical protein